MIGNLVGAAIDLALGFVTIGTTLLIVGFLIGGGSALVELGFEAGQALIESIG